MSPLPVRMADHWGPRADIAGRAVYHWHMLFGDQPAVHELAALAQRKLDGLPGLDPVPLRWLHLTTLVVGFADEVPPPSLDTMLSTARGLLAELEPIGVSLGRVLYHPEAVVLAVEPPTALEPVLSAVAIATREAGLPGRTATDPWLPHITVAYSNCTGPAEPVIEAVGRRLPPTEITIRSVSLVAQRQVGHSWQWQLVDEVRLRPSGVQGRPSGVQGRPSGAQRRPGAAQRGPAAAQRPKGWSFQ
jgi:2'-5' RNA ligase